jgi:hypothetical protein
MQVGRDGRKHWARFMLTGQARDPAQAILGFCELVRRLPNAGCDKSGMTLEAIPCTASQATTYTVQELLTAEAAERAEQRP